MPISTCETYERSRGRIENRRVELYKNKIELPQGWSGIQRFAKVRRWGTRNGKDYHDVSFFILSKPINHAQSVANGIRNHWSIENNLHWTKDVLMGEDAMTIKNHNAATFVAHLNTLAINLLRLAGYKPIKDTFAKFTNKVNELETLIKGKYNFS